MRWTPDRAVRDRAPAGALRCVLGQELFSRSASLRPERFKWVFTAGIHCRYSIVCSMSELAIGYHTCTHCGPIVLLPPRVEHHIFSVQNGRTVA